MISKTLERNWMKSAGGTGESHWPALCYALSL